MAKAQKMTKKAKTMNSTKSVKAKKTVKKSSKTTNASPLEQSINMSWKQRGYAFLLLGVISGSLSIMLMQYAALPYFTAVLIAIGLAFLAKSYAMTSEGI